MDLVDGVVVRDWGTALAQIQDFLLPSVVLRLVWLIDEDESLQSLRESASCARAVVIISHGSGNPYQKPIRTFAFLRPFVAQLQGLFPVPAGDRILDGTYSAFGDRRIGHIQSPVCDALKGREKVMRGIFGR